MAAILYRYAQYKGYSVGTTGSLGGFADANRISDYATAAFYWICGRGIMEGTTATTLGPAELFHPRAGRNYPDALLQRVQSVKAKYAYCFLYLCDKQFTLAEKTGIHSFVDALFFYK